MFIKKEKSTLFNLTKSLTVISKSYLLNYLVVYLKIFILWNNLNYIAIFGWRDSSVGRAAHRCSSGRRFNPQLRQLSYASMYMMRCLRVYIEIYIRVWSGICSLRDLDGYVKMDLRLSDPWKWRTIKKKSPK